jgi:glyoxylase-like metal-dependent hydrolase (beta-lactamase superfamily II)
MKKTLYTLSALTLAVALAGCNNSLPGGAVGDHDNHADSTTAPSNQGLSTVVFNPGEAAMFPVSSVLVQGQKEALLIDAQFNADQARKLVETIQASGKQLTTIYISHADPDFYFGLDTLHAAFPDARILATAQTIAHIQAKKDEELKIWGPRMGDNAPKQLIVPQPLQGDSLALEGEQLQIIGLDGPTPDRSFVWIPSLKTVAGGIPVWWGAHVWMADTTTAQSHADWQATLERINALQPTTVIPGHYVGEPPAGLAAVDFTADYLRAFDEEAAKAKDSAALVTALQQRYPKLGGASWLELGAKVSKGEMPWK